MLSSLFQPVRRTQLSHEPLYVHSRESPPVGKFHDLVHSYWTSIRYGCLSHVPSEQSDGIFSNKNSDTGKTVSNQAV